MCHVTYGLWHSPHMLGETEAWSSGWTDVAKLSAQTGPSLRRY